MLHKLWVLMKEGYLQFSHHTMKIPLLHTTLTLALDGGEWSASWPSHFTPTGKAPTPSGQETGWALEPVQTQWPKEKLLSLLGIKPHS